MAELGVLAGMPTLLGPTPLRCKLNALEDDIPNTMTQFQTTVFKLGERAVVWLLSIPTQGCIGRVD